MHYIPLFYAPPFPRHKVACHPLQKQDVVAILKLKTELLVKMRDCDKMPVASAQDKTNGERSDPWHPT
ncbi:MAG: hypothetical protein SF339_28630 [Blastocatellia bacterium]|nr:hypothetical protein [Blastocatellia bacterium]